MLAQNEVEKVAQEIYKSLESQIRPQLGDIFQDFSQEFLDYSVLLARLQAKMLSSPSENTQYAIQNCEAGIKLLTARVRKKTENATARFVEAAATMILQGIAIFGKAYIGSISGKI